jgi:HK97 family phage major capsid protein
MWARSRANAVWFINQDVEPQLYPLALANPSGAILYQAPLYTPPGVNGNNGPYGLLFGKPVIPIEQASTCGTQGDMTLADMTQYILATRSDVRADTSIHVAFLTGEQAFRFMLRLDGQPTWKKPLTPYQGSTLKSPFVQLATRS